MIGRNALILLGFLLSSTANADPVKIAVAANMLAMHGQQPETVAEPQPE